MRCEEKDVWKTYNTVVKKQVILLLSYIKRWAIEQLNGMLIETAMRILSIETSCDETAVALVSFTSLSPKSTQINCENEQLYSQASLHAEYGGVYPTLAKREHQKILPFLTKKLLQEEKILEKNNEQPLITKSELAELCKQTPILLQNIQEIFLNTKVKDIDAIAVTHGPGLAPALWVGVTFAHALARLFSLPVIPVNHMEGHIFSALIDENNYYTEPTYPLLSLLVSGGHTELILTKKKNVYEKVGGTVDDAAGEAFDKAARLLGLSYPGGPEISRLAEQAREHKLVSPFKLPRPMLLDTSYNFSYAGIKTALRVALERHGSLSENERSAIAKEFEDAIVETLIEKTRRVVERYNIKTVVVGGGVSANKHLREEIITLKEQFPDLTLYLSKLKYATDNALMIAISAYEQKENPLPLSQLKAIPNLSFPLHSTE